jgi:hypothetical protein
MNFLVPGAGAPGLAFETWEGSNPNLANRSPHPSEARTKAIAHPHKKSHCFPLRDRINFSARVLGPNSPAVNFLRSQSQFTERTTRPLGALYPR